MLAKSMKSRTAHLKPSDGAKECFPVERLEADEVMSVSAGVEPQTRDSSSQDGAGGATVFDDDTTAQEEQKGAGERPGEGVRLGRGPIIDTSGWYRWPTPRYGKRS